MKPGFIMLVVMAITGAALATVPVQVNYQGLLARTSGTPLDTTVAMTFRLHSENSGGTNYWTETQPGVVVSGGLFRVALGQYVSMNDDLFDHAHLWLGVAVGSDAEMTPRVELRSVPYARQVGTIDHARGGQIDGNVNIGWQNTNSGDSSFVMGTYNSAFGAHSVVSGGRSNVAVGILTTVGGGYSNYASGSGSTIAGGSNNTVNGDSGAVGGGAQNWASTFGAVGGGSSNYAGYASTVGGGRDNSASANWATVSGGDHNTASGIQTFVGGGEDNSASGIVSAIAGGSSNTAEGWYGAVPGGYGNHADGNFSFAAGHSASVSGSHSFALGTNISCVAESALVWSDGSGPTLSIGSSRTFSVKATAGTRIWTSSGLTSGVTIGAGGNAWVAVCDSTKKRNIRLVDTRDILARFSALPLKRWEYKSEDQGVEHIGPMAQDFWNAFRLGNEPLGISSIDADGVMMAAMQELARQNTELKTSLDELRTQMQALQAATRSGTTQENK